MGVFYRPPSTSDQDSGHLILHIQGMAEQFKPSHLLLLRYFHAQEVSQNAGPPSVSGFHSEILHLFLLGNENSWTQHVHSLTRYRQK